jgi:hypothetical protein
MCGPLKEMRYDGVAHVSFFATPINTLFSHMILVPRMLDSDNEGIMILQGTGNYLSNNNTTVRSSNLSFLRSQ